MQNQLFVENRTRYLISYQNKEFKCWREVDRWLTDNYCVLPDDKVQIINRIGTPKEIYNISK